mgnify:CR=1 FL=1
MGFMDKLKETAGKAAEKAGAMKDSAMEIVKSVLRYIEHIKNMYQIV